MTTPPHPEPYSGAPAGPEVSDELSDQDLALTTGGLFCTNV